MQINTIQPAIKYQDIIQKITVFITSEKINFQQKITPSPFTCLSYNHFDIPKFKVKNTIIEAQSKIQITGPKTNDDIFALHNGRLFQILIELQPTYFFYLFNKSPQLYENNIIPLVELVARKKVEQALNSLTGNNESEILVPILCDFLLELYDETKLKVEYIEDAVALIEKEKGNVSVSLICERINKSERQFNRKFTEIIGIAPMLYIKIRQLHFIINRFQRNHFESFKELAYDTGFYDPAHFNNRFKKLTGMSPGQFIKSDEHVAMDYYSDLI